MSTKKAPKKAPKKAAATTPKAKGAKAAAAKEAKPKGGTICTIAGTGEAALGEDGQLATETELYLPEDLTAGPDGRLYMMDWNNHRVRRLNADGKLETIIGTGELGDGGLVAESFELSGVAHHPAGHELHHLEGCAEHGVVIAHRHRPGHRHRGVTQRRHHAVLTGHVVGGRRQTVQRRATHQPVGLVVVDPERQIGPATGDEVSAQFAVAFDPERTQVPVQGGQVQPVELVSRSHRTCLPSLVAR